MHFEGQISQNYHGFALFQSSNMGNLVTLIYLIKLKGVHGLEHIFEKVDFGLPCMTCNFMENLVGQYSSTIAQTGKVLL